MVNILIRNADQQPIYEQIYVQIKTAILSDELQEGAMLPSIRALAKDLRISVITTKRAYDELERDGYLFTVAGKGCYVAPKNTEMIRETHLRQIEAYMQKIRVLALPLQLTEAELTEMLRLTLEEDNQDECH